MRAKREVLEGGWEIGEGLVECKTEFEVDEGAREAQSLVEPPAKTEKL